MITSLQELSEGYDSKPEKEKKKIPVARTTGFMTKDGERRYIVDQNTQLDLKTMKWFLKDDLGINFQTQFQSTTYKSIKPA